MKFVVVEDNKQRHLEMAEIIDKVLFKKKINIEVLSFYEYNHQLEKEIENQEIKIYILDIEVPNRSGIEIARDIREKCDDWSSVIIITSVHSKQYDALTNRLMLLTYISKFDDFKNRLNDSVELALNIVTGKSSMQIKDGDSTYILNKKDILCIEKINGTKYCLIQTVYKDYRVRSSLQELEEMTKLIRIKKHLLVNKENVVSKSKETIIFKNGISINL